MQALTATHRISDPLVERHFDASAKLYVDHALEVYRTSVRQRLDLMSRFAELSNTDEVALLDIGCGGGAFLDMFLERFPKAHATGIDISTQMLANNHDNRRKTLLVGDALALPQELGEFDAICVDTVMHHLIARKSYRQTVENIRSFLLSLHQHMRPGGVIVIREIYHEYRLQAELGTRAIYEMTTLKVPALVAKVMRAAGLQTASIGVCFLSRRQWLRLFEEAGFKVAAQEDHVWPGQPYRRFGFTQSGDLHFVLTRSRPHI